MQGVTILPNARLPSESLKAYHARLNSFKTTVDSRKHGYKWLHQGPLNVGRNAAKRAKKAAALNRRAHAWKQP